jgi:hypothetical protein
LISSRPFSDQDTRPSHSPHPSPPTPAHTLCKDYLPDCIVTSVWRGYGAACATLLQSAGFLLLGHENENRHVCLRFPLFHIHKKICNKSGAHKWSEKRCREYDRLTKYNLLVCGIDNKHVRQPTFFGQLQRCATLALFLILRCIRTFTRDCSRTYQVSLFTHTSCREYLKQISNRSREVGLDAFDMGNNVPLLSGVSIRTLFLDSKAGDAVCDRDEGP